MKPVRLYIKEHQITGLRYLGKTVKDPYSYNGSGTYWTNHYKKYGKEHIKTLWVSEEIYDEEYLKEFAEFLSEELNVIKSKKWANQIIETGIGGFGAGEDNIAKSDIIRNKISNSLMGHKYGMTGKIHSEETKQKMSESAKKAGTGKSLKGKSKSQEHKNNIALASLNRKKEKCIHCGLECAVNVLNRWHNDKCKGNINA